MKKEIEHEGVVESVNGASVVVKVLQASACSACAAASLCRSSETKEKIIDAVLDARQEVSVGQRVVVVGEMSLGLQASLLAYVFPIIVVVLVLAVVQNATSNEALGALSALAALAVCYGVLWLFRDRLKRRFTFRIKEIGSLV